MATVFQEWQNQNSQRNFPFCDTASLQDEQGNTLPADFLIDANLFPFDLQGFCYLASIDGQTQTLNWADSATGDTVGTTQWLSGQQAAPCYDVSGYNRPIGTVVFGPGVATIEGNQLRQFAPPATQLTPTTFCALNQIGVRGILLPDGTIMTGSVTMTGQDGVVVTSVGNTIRVDCIGVPALDASACQDLGVPICTIQVDRIAGSVFLASFYEPTITHPNALALTVNGLDLDSICSAAKARRQTAVQPAATIVIPPDPLHTSPTGPANIDTIYTTSGDACLPPGPPVPTLDPGLDETFTFNICQSATGAFFIVAPSAINYLNPILIDTTQPAPAISPLGYQTEQTATVAVDQFTNPGLPQGAVLLSIQGIGKGQQS